MKIIQRSICLLLVLVTMLSIWALPAYARPVTETVSGNAGKVIDVEFKFENVMALTGYFAFSNPELFSSIQLTSDKLVGFYNQNSQKADYFSAQPEDCSLFLRLTVSYDAEIGDLCEITFQYETTDSGYLPATPEYKYDRVVVTIVRAVDYSALNEAISKANALLRADYTASTWAQMQLAYVVARRAVGCEDQSTVDSAANALNDALSRLKKVSVDYSALKKQIRIAEALTEADYTADSWAKLLSQMNIAKSALSSQEQEEVDKATADLNTAIQALVRDPSRPITIDYSELQRHIAKAEALDEALYTEDSWFDLMVALTVARGALESKDQSWVTGSAIDLENAVAALKKITAVHIDYSELEKQIAVAESVVLSDYTADSRATLTNALQSAKEAREIKDQNRVDVATGALKDAIGGLIRMDFAALVQAIQTVREFSEKDLLSADWLKMSDLLTKSVELMQSGDQAGVDQCAKDIVDLLTQIATRTDQLSKTEIIEVEKLVPTEPSDDYCNVTFHPVWQILFWISLAVNLVGILLIVGFLVLRRRKLSDDTPLVDYDIEDDAE